MGDELTFVHREVANVLGLLGALAALLAFLGCFAGGFLARGFLLGHENDSPKCGGVELWASRGRHAPDITGPIGEDSGFLANNFFCAGNSCGASADTPSSRAAAFGSLRHVCSALLRASFKLLCIELSEPANMERNSLMQRTVVHASARRREAFVGRAPLAVLRVAHSVLALRA